MSERGDNEIDRFMEAIEQQQGSPQHNDGEWADLKFFGEQFVLEERYDDLADRLREVEEQRDELLARLLADRLREVEEQRDELLARLAKLDTPHVLVLGPNRWTIEHSLECRESGRMAECSVHETVCAWIDEVGEPDLPKGRYVIGGGPFPDSLSPQGER